MYGVKHIIVLCFLKAFVHVLGYVNDWDKFMPSGDSTPVIEYIYYTQHMTWNDARSACVSKGGDLATIHSDRTLQVIELTTDEYNSASAGTNILIFNDYWVGLTEVTEGATVWADNCSSLSYHDGFDTAWNASLMCFYMSGDHSKGYRDACNTLRSFMCEREVGERCTSFVGILNVDYVSYVADSDVCDQQCLYDSQCIGTMFVSQLLCHVIYRTGTNVTSSAPLTVKARSCIKVTVNSTQMTDVINDSLYPDEVCGSSLTSDSTPTTTTPAPTITTTAKTTTVRTTTTSSEVSSDASSSFAPVFSSILAQTTTAIPTSTSALGESSLDISNDNCTCTDVTENTVSAITSSTSATACLGQDQSATVTLLSETGQTYICQQYTQTNLSTDQIEEKAEEISKNLTISAKETSAYLRTLICVDDKRTSSVVMGTVGVICVTIPVVVLVLSDLKLLYDFVVAGHF